MLLRAIANAVAGHVRPAGLQLDHTDITYPETITLRKTSDPRHIFN